MNLPVEKRLPFVSRTTPLMYRAEALEPIVCVPPQPGGRTGDGDEEALSPTAFLAVSPMKYVDSFVSPVSVIEQQLAVVANAEGSDADQVVQAVVATSTR